MQRRFFDIFERALGWLSANRDRISLPDAESMPIDGQKDPDRKAFCELSVACLVMSRSADATASADFWALIERIRQCAARSEAFRGAARRPYLFQSALLAYSALSTCGVESADLRDLVDRNVAMGYVDRLDRTPWNQADFRFHLDGGRFRHALPELEHIYRVSTLFSPPNIPLLHSYDAYAITHLIFFLSGFGARPLSPLLGERYSRTCEYANLLLGVYAHRRDIDLIAEILICCACLEMTRSATTDAAWELLAGAQEPSGAVRAVTGDSFEKLFHPTVVTLIAALLWHARN